MKSTKTLFRLLVSGALTASMLLPSSLAVYQAKVKADSLYLRSAPGGSIIAELSQGTTVAVMNNSSEWYKVIVNGKEGYVSGSYLTGTTATDFTVGSGKITCSSTVNLRSEPNTSSGILASLSNGTAVSVTGVSGGWYKVTANGKSGYVHPDYVTIGGASAASGSSSTTTAATTAAPTTGKVTCSSTVNLRAEANTSSGILASLSNGTAVTLGAKENGWYKGTVNGKSGYIKADYISTSVSSSTNMASYSGLSAKRTAVLDYAAKFLGVPYVYGGSTPSGFDCSGFTSYVYKNTVCSIERVAQAQFDTTTRVSRDELLPGDLVFFGSSAYSISHVGIYVGDDEFIHAPHTGDVVKYESLSGSYASRFQGGGRVIFD